MRKWILLLAAALLFNVVHAQAEEIFYTNNRDRYYHSDPDCDRPAEIAWWGNTPREFYEREVYKKYEISQVAAAEFEKKPCPVCVKTFEPVYLGDHLPEWNFEVEPWKISGMEKQKITDGDFLKEVSDTHQAFDEYYEEYAEYMTGIIKRKHDYPSCFGGKYRNIQSSMTYLIVDPTDEILNTFKKMFGGGAWIISAKYGCDEMQETSDRVFRALIDLCAEHPEWDAGASTAGVNVVNNCVDISIWGEDWQLAAAALEEISPIYVHFEKGGKNVTTDGF